MWTTLHKTLDTSPTSAMNYQSKLGQAGNKVYMWSVADIRMML
jgi:hypothetical protein